MFKHNKFFISLFLCFINLLVEADSSIPVIFVHSGDAFYLKDTLTQAKKFNDRVILIGDEDNKYCAQEGVEYHPISDFNKSGSYFTTIYRHMSQVPYHIELACFTRWYILQEFMENNNIPLSFYVDSDVMLYCDISKGYEMNFQNCNLGVALQYGFCGGLVSYWTTKSINSFCSFLTDFYEDTENLDILEDQFKLGGEQYQDDWPQMTNWVHENSSNLTLGNLSGLINNTTFDSSIWHDYILVPNAASVLEYKRYRMKENNEPKRFNEKWMKDIIWHKGIPYCYSADLGIFIQFNALHFQGGAKIFIDEFKSEKVDQALPEPYDSVKTLPFYMLSLCPSENQKNLESFIKIYKPKTIVDLGSWLGFSASFMAFFMPENGKVYAVDNFESKSDAYLSARKDVNPTSYTLYQQFLSNMKHYRLCDRVIPIKMNTSDAALSLNIKADLIYVDASSEEDSVYQDIMDWYPKLNKNGIICGNNWKWFEAVQRGVFRAAIELKRTVKVDNNFWYFDLIDIQGE